MSVTAWKVLDTGWVWRVIRAEQFPIIKQLWLGGFPPYVSSLKREQYNAKAQSCFIYKLEKYIHWTTTGILHMDSVSLRVAIEKRRKDLSESWKPGKGGLLCMSRGC